MKKNLLSILILVFMANIQICFAIGSLQKNKKGQIIRIPADFPSITQAVTHARDGDFILLAPGNYNENEISIDKRIVISSEWKQDGDASKIENTIIDAGDKILFNIQSDGVEISGLKIINGDHPLNIESNVIIAHNHFVNNKDAISFEGSGGGYAGYNTIENDRDDGIDLDIRKGGKHQGADITVEYNTILNSNDDGIEIRFYDYPGQNIRYTIRNNTISGSINAGIQLISYDIFTAKEFHIHHNIIKECKVGLGCMDGTNTREDLEGASTLDEKIYFYNNTLTGNQLGATGGNSVYALNNVVKNNILGGFKRFGKNSAIVNNLFYQNGNNDFQEVNEQVIQHSNRFGEWPLLCEKTFAPLADSPCIDAGKKQLNINGKRVLKISGKAFLGNKPDLGAVEYN